MRTWWSRASVGARLFCSFSVAVVLLALTGVLGARAMSRMNESVDSVASVRLPIIVNLLEADRDLHQALVAERTLILGRMTGASAQPSVHAWRPGPRVQRPGSKAGQA